MICDFTVLGYSVLAAYLLAGTIFVTGGYFFARRIFAKPSDVSKLSDKSFKIASDSGKQGQSVNRAA